MLTPARHSGPIGAVSLAIFFLSWPQEKYRPVLIKHSWKELDFPGSLLTIAAAVLVVFAFQNTGASSSSNEGNNWSSPVFIAALIVGLVCWVALFSWEYLVERYFEAHIAPVFPIRLFRRGIYAPGAINTLLNGFPYILLIYAVPLRIQVVGGKSPLLAGAMMLPMLVAVAVASALSGAANAKRQIIVETMVVGSCLMLLGCGLLTTLSVEELDTAKLLVFTAFCGFGFGLTVSASTMIAAHEAERDYGESDWPVPRRAPAGRKYD